MYDFYSFAHIISGRIILKCHDNNDLHHPSNMYTVYTGNTNADNNFYYEYSIKCNFINIPQLKVHVRFSRTYNVRNTDIQISIHNYDGDWNKWLFVAHLFTLYWCLQTTWTLFTWVSKGILPKGTDDGKLNVLVGGFVEVVDMGSDKSLTVMHCQTTFGVLSEVSQGPTCTVHHISILTLLHHLSCKNPNSSY